MTLRHLLISALLLCGCASAQDSAYPSAGERADLSGPIVRTTFHSELAESPYEHADHNDSAGSSTPSVVAQPLATVPPPGAAAILPVPQRSEIKPRTVDWTRAAEQSFFFLSIQHATRIVQRKTRRELGGKFFHEWVNAVDGVAGWGDGDSILTNYVGHPMMGAISGYILIQNDPDGIAREFDLRDRKYWNSRLRAMGWAAVYSTQFELGPVSEATIGHVGKHRGTAGFVDLVMTPVGGFGWILAEDAADRWVKKLEQGRSDGFKRAIRIALSPNRAFANVLRFKKPWHRDTRPMDWD